jgi:hypothetical protein
MTLRRVLLGGMCADDSLWFVLRRISLCAREEPIKYCYVVTFSNSILDMTESM